MPTIKDHALACIFPLLSDADLAILAGDIEANGQQEPIWVYEDCILDGRNRYRACLLKGVEPRFADYEGAEPLLFVISKNLHRRHLTEAQRAMVAAEIANMNQGERTDLEPSANLQKVSVADAAKMLNVSDRSVATAKKVKDDAEPEIVEAVKAGKLPVSTAAKASELPPKKQREIAKAKEPAKAAREAVKEAEAKAETKAEPVSVDPLDGFVGELNRVSRAVDALKKDIQKAVASHPLGGKFVHLESVFLSLSSARSTIWQSRPTEVCNCVRNGGKIKPECRACHGCGKCAVSMVLKGGK